MSISKNLLSNPKKRSNPKYHDCCQLKRAETLESHLTLGFPDSVTSPTHPPTWRPHAATGLLCFPRTPLDITGLPPLTARRDTPAPTALKSSSAHVGCTWSRPLPPRLGAGLSDLA